ncbi:hypothetical protein HMN09_01299400 [Mycena chlorophos]|uniref:F-box domain-containing protein n=1 Tax=Mycena chlorophos TaxID=658473 RepID=A0A8H6S0L9_MYCCL|nr:hypothetical protein HMN09_01299400 [Mycena chlorophos]
MITNLVVDGPPRLPPELEREIFECASLEDAAVLVLVARRVYDWIQPIRFRVLCIDGCDKSEAFLAMFRTDPTRLPFLASKVRHLWFDRETQCTPAEACTILSACKNLYNFATIGHFSNPNVLPVLATLRVTRLSLCLEVLFGGREHIDLLHPSLENLTHFDVFDAPYSAVGSESTMLLELLPTLPALTHVCLSRELPTVHIEPFLARCPRLEQFLMYQAGGIDQFYEDRREVEDPRVVYGSFQSSRYWVQWKEGACGSPIFWEKADELVARRRRETARIQNASST